MQRFLIIQTAFIGDVILCTPILSELKRLYPNAEIDVVVRKGNESLLENHPATNIIFSWDKKSGKYASLFNIIKQIRKKKYDEVINLQRFHSAGLICLFSRGTKKIGFSKNKFRFMYDIRVPHPFGDGTHEVTRNLGTIAHHSGAEQLVRPSLYPSAQDEEMVQCYKKIKNYICLAPASVWETKKLPLNKWVELINNTDPSITIYMIGGPGDNELCSTIIEQTHHKSITNLCGSLSLLQSAALMRDAQMNYVNDSGPLHLASSVNAPTTAFFCSTVPRFGFGPLADISHIVEIKEALNCRPCGIHGFKKCPEGHFKCGRDIKIKPLTNASGFN